MTDRENELLSIIEAMLPIVEAHRAENAWREGKGPANVRYLNEVDELIARANAALPGAVTMSL